jgi:hypothetical protein
MCMSKPKMPKAPPPVQPAQMPDVNILRDRMRRASNGGTPIIGGSLLTGPQGLGTPATAKATLLGQ